MIDVLLGKKGINLKQLPSAKLGQFQDNSLVCILQHVMGLLQHVVITHQLGMASHASSAITGDDRGPVEVL